MTINPLSATAVQQALFKAGDKDKNGKVGKSEFADLLAKVSGGKAPTQAQAAAQLAALDSDGDGSLSLNEFEAANINAAQSTQNQSANLYAALVSAGVAQSNVGSNVYDSLLNGSLSNAFTSTGTLVGQIVGGAITKVTV